MPLGLNSSGGLNARLSQTESTKTVPHKLLKKQSHYLISPGSSDSNLPMNFNHRPCRTWIWILQKPHNKNPITVPESVSPNVMLLLLWNQTTPNVVCLLLVNVLFSLRSLKKSNPFTDRSQVAERLGNRATNLKVASSIPGHAKWRCGLGQGTLPYLPRGECSCTYCKSLWIRASAKCNVM